MIGERLCVVCCSPVGMFDECCLAQDPSEALAEAFADMVEQAERNDGPDR